MLLHGFSLPGSSVHGDVPGKNTGVGCHFLLQGIVSTQESNLGLLHCRQILYQLSYQGSPPSSLFLFRRCPQEALVPCWWKVRQTRKWVFDWAPEWPSGKLRWTLLPPPSPYHPSGLSQCTSPKHPVSCIEPGLATCFIFDIIHVSMPFSLH